ncbi:MAG: hypothetical protein ACTSVO_10200 [Candidatus Heimdallarchaeaceae archaeon]
MNLKKEIIKESDTIYKIASNCVVREVRARLSTIATSFTSKGITIYGSA